MSGEIGYYAEVITKVLGDDKFLTKFIASRSEVGQNKWPNWRKYQGRIVCWIVKTIDI